MPSSNPGMGPPQCMPPRRSQRVKSDLAAGPLPPPGPARGCGHRPLRSGHARHPGRTEPVRRASLAAAGPAIKEQPFRIVVRGVDKKLLREMWQRLCHEYPHNTPPDFNEMYEHAPRFSDDPFAFKKGDPKEFRETFQNLLYIHGIEGAVVTVER